MISTETESLILLQVILYHGLWGMAAYAVPRQKNTLFYGSALVVIISQIIAAGINLPNPTEFISKVILLTTIGVGIDTVFTRKGWFKFASSKRCIPAWLFLLWISFALAMQYVAIFFPSEFYIWAVLGGFGFPLSYYVAERLKVLRVDRPNPVYVYQGLFWSIFLPIVLSAIHF